eukprot:g18211.t1
MQEIFDVLQADQGKVIARAEELVSENVGILKENNALKQQHKKMRSVTIELGAAEQTIRELSKDKANLRKRVDDLVSELQDLGNIVSGNKNKRRKSKDEPRRGAPVPEGEQTTSTPAPVSVEEGAQPQPQLDEFRGLTPHGDHATANISTRAQRVVTQTEELKLELKQKNDEIAKLTTSLTKMQKSATELRKTVRKFEQGLIADGDKDAAIFQLERKVRLLEKNKFDLEKRNDGAEAKVAELKRKISDMKAICAELKAVIAEKEGEIESVKEEVAKEIMLEKKKLVEELAEAKRTMKSDVEELMEAHTDELLLGFVEMEAAVLEAQFKSLKSSSGGGKEEGEEKVFDEKGSSTSPTSPLVARPGVDHEDANHERSEKLHRLAGRAAFFEERLLSLLEKNQQKKEKDQEDPSESGSAAKKLKHRADSLLALLQDVNAELDELRAERFKSSKQNESEHRRKESYIDVLEHRVGLAHSERDQIKKDAQTTRESAEQFQQRSEERFRILEKNLERAQGEIERKEIAIRNVEARLTAKAVLVEERSGMVEHLEKRLEIEKEVRRRSKALEEVRKSSTAAGVEKADQTTNKLELDTEFRFNTEETTTEQAAREVQQFEADILQHSFKLVKRIGGGYRYHLHDLPSSEQQSSNGNHQHPPLSNKKQIVHFGSSPTAAEMQNAEHLQFEISEARAAKFLSSVQAACGPTDSIGQRNMVNALIKAAKKSGASESDITRERARLLTMLAMDRSVGDADRKSPSTQSQNRSASPQVVAGLGGAVAAQGGSQVQSKGKGLVFGSYKPMTSSNMR